jgi:hypothetical protein
MAKLELNGEERWFVRTDDKGVPLDGTIALSNLIDVFPECQRPDMDTMIGLLQQKGFYPVADPVLEPLEENEYYVDTGELKIVKSKKTATIVVEKKTFDADAMKHKLIRGQVAFLLSTSDWTQVADAPLTAAEKKKWATYRQELRDMTSTFPDPKKAADITWPKAPNWTEEAAIPE